MVQLRCGLAFSSSVLALVAAQHWDIWVELQVNLSLAFFLGGVSVLLSGLVSIARLVWLALSIG